jgi:hypothetical protein
MAREGNISRQTMLGAAVTMSIAALLAADPIKGCEVYGPAFGLERLIRCSKFYLEVYPPMPSAVEKAVLTEQAKMAAGSTEGREILSMADVVIGGKKRTAVRYLRRRSDGARDVGMVITVPAGPGNFRLVHCFNAMESGCMDVFALLMKAFPDVSGGPGPPQPLFAGRALAVPAGCTRKGPGQIVCPQAELSWLPLYDGAPETFGEVEPMVKRSVGYQGEFEAFDRYCELGGVDALCRVATVKARGKVKSWLVYGFGTVRGVKLWAMCSTHTDPKGGLPAPCSDVLAFKP